MPQDEHLADTSEDGLLAHLHSVEAGRDEMRGLIDAQMVYRRIVIEERDRLREQRDALLEACEAVPLDGLWEAGADAEWLGRLSSAVARIRAEGPEPGPTRQACDRCRRSAIGSARICTDRPPSLQRGARMSRFTEAHRKAVEDVLEEMAVEGFVITNDDDETWALAQRILAVLETVS